MTNVWLPQGSSAANAGLRLFCLPHAGAGANAFRPWLAQSPTGIVVSPVQLPGREGRWSESPATDLYLLAANVVDAVGTCMEPPFAVFGHSFGGLLAFEVVRRLVAMGRRPAQLLVSGIRAPHLPHRDPVLHQMSDLELRDHLRELGGTPHAVLDHAEFLAAFLPTLRTDCAMAETYIVAVGDPLPLPITAYFAEDDQTVSEEEMHGWQAWSNTVVDVVRLPGDHSSYLRNPAPLLDDLIQRLEPLARQA